MRIQTRLSYMRATFKHQTPYLNLPSVDKKTSMSKNHRMDSFIRSSLAGDVESSTTYAKSAGKRLQGKVSDAMLDAFNFYDAKLKYLDNDQFEYDGTIFSVDQLREVPESRCKEIKAINNVITFEAGAYYQYKRADGTTDVMFSAKENAHMGSLFSDYYLPTSVKSDEAMKNASDTAWYWNMMKEGSCVYTTLQMPREEEKKILEAAGLQPGFFTIERPQGTDTFFYKEGPYVNNKVSKARYDGGFKGFTEGNFLRDYKPGDICTVDGKEYTIDENRHIDIPYGADIYVIEYPHERAKRLASNPETQ